MLIKLVKTIKPISFDTELEIFEDDNRNYWFRGKTLCDMFTLHNQTIEHHVDIEWRCKFPDDGTLDWYIMIPGVYQLLLASKHPDANSFLKWLFWETMLNK